MTENVIYRNIFNRLFCVQQLEFPPRGSAPRSILKEKDYKIGNFFEESQSTQYQRMRIKTDWRESRECL